jgi:YidC/Oxa1 family membrane protein insertase
LLLGAVESTLIGLHDALVSACVSKAYGITIILFTIGIKTLTRPLNAVQMESTLKMQYMSARLKQIQAHNKDSPTVKNQMIAQLYKDEKSNPLLGCLPALVQIPVWIALYRTVLKLAKENLLKESYHTSYNLYCTDSGSKENLLNESYRTSYNLNCTDSGSWHIVTCLARTTKRGASPTNAASVALDPAHLQPAPISCDVSSDAPS